MNVNQQLESKYVKPDIIDMFIKIILLRNHNKFCINFEYMCGGSK